jgi:catalase
VEENKFLELPLKISGYADCCHARDGAGGYEQACGLFRLMGASPKEQLFSTTAEAMQGVPERIMARQQVHFYKANPEHERCVAKKLGDWAARRS